MTERRQRRFDRVRRDPVHLRAQDDVDDRGGPRAGRRARGHQQGRAGRAAGALHAGARWARTSSRWTTPARAGSSPTSTGCRTPRCARWRSPTGRWRRARTRRPTQSLERDLIFVGTVGIIDPPREEAAVAIREAHRAGIRVIMITGDHPRTAARIAADLGIVEPRRARADGTRARRAGRRGLRRRGALDVGLRARGARAQAADRRRAAGRRPDRGDDRRRRERRARAQVGGHRRRDGRHRHRGHQAGGRG